MPWLDLKSVRPLSKFSRTGSGRGGKVAVLPDMTLGDSRWTNPSGIILDLPNQANDGLLSLEQLGMKIIHFDFERNLMSWNK